MLGAPGPGGRSCCGERVRGAPRGRGAARRASGLRAVVTAVPAPAPAFANFLLCHRLPLPRRLMQGALFHKHCAGALTALAPSRAPLQVRSGNTCAVLGVGAEQGMPSPAGV